MSVVGTLFGVVRARMQPLARAERDLRRQAKALKPKENACGCEYCFEVWRQHMEAAHNVELMAEEMLRRWEACMLAPGEAH